MRAPAASAPATNTAPIASEATREADTRVTRASSLASARRASATSTRSLISASCRRMPSTSAAVGRGPSEGDATGEPAGPLCAA